METQNGRFMCVHCGIGFPRPNRTGRKPQYCGASCRQRAFEARRRAALHAGFPVAGPPPTRRERRPDRYESGLTARRRHALRDEGFPDPWGRRQTLCGSWARPTATLFGEHRESDRPTCLTCQEIVVLHPPRGRPDPLRELPAMRALLRRARADLLAAGPPAEAIADLFRYAPR
ncbi:MAG: hypothetical protein GEV08_25670 [Acidimicrobiia bacterium]|nr:hypothetical protein [Acidimicrobiia bacterium]